MSEEEFEGQEEGTEEDGLRKQISLGLQLNPVTTEMGVVIGIGEEKTWMSISEAKKFIGEVDIIIATGITFGVTQSLLTRTPGPDAGSGLITP